MRRLTPRSRSAEATAWALTSMIASGLFSIARRLPALNAAPIPRLTKNGRARKRRRCTGSCPQARVADVVRAQLIAMHDQRRRAMKVVHHLVREQGRAARLGETLAEQKVAVAALQIHRRSRPRKLG